MAEFSCENETNGDSVQYEDNFYSVDIHCAAIWFTNAAISGINVTVETQGMSAIVLHNVSDTHIQLNVMCTKEQRTSRTMHGLITLLKLEYWRMKAVTFGSIYQ